MEDETRPVLAAERYRHFATVEGDPRSPRYAEWARGVANDAEVLELLAARPAREQQPNLLFAAIRFVGIDVVAPWSSIRSDVLAHWARIVDCLTTRRTQTNEPRRLATLLPALAALPQPLAIIEVGASMGLCLQPTRWSYRYTGSSGVTTIGSGPALECSLVGAAPTMPEVVHCAGLDLHPLSAHDSDQVRWLETLIWPIGAGSPDTARLDRLHAAVEIARRHGPAVRTGDLVTDTAALVEQVSSAAPQAATTVLFHSAVLAYLEPAERERFAAIVRGLDVTWISNEGIPVLPEVAARLPVEPGSGDFCIAVDGSPFALADAHGRWVHLL